MRTLHINTERGWRGGEQQALHLMRGLAQRGHSADVACRRGEPLAARAKDAGLMTLEVRPYGELDLPAAARIARFVAERGHDVIHAHTAHAHMLGLAARWMAAPFLGRLVPLVVSRRVDFSARKLPLPLIALKYRLGVARYLAVSTRVRDVLREDGVPIERVRVVPSSVDLALFEGVSAEGLREELGIARMSKVIVSVGALVDHKAQWRLVEAMPRVLERFPETVCFIVGEGPTRPRLEKLSAELKLGPHLALTGFREDAARFVKLCDVFVIASEMEGLCGSILEAMALRRPIVTTAAGGIPDIVKNEVNGLLVPPADPEALATGIIRLLEDRATAERYAEEGRRTVERRFTVERMVESTIAAYEELL